MQKTSGPRRSGLASASFAVMALVVGMLGLAGPASAAGTHTVTVNVTAESDPTGLGGLTVSLGCDSTGTCDPSYHSGGVETSASGQAVFTGVPEGDYFAYVDDERDTSAYFGQSTGFTLAAADQTVNVGPLSSYPHCNGPVTAVGSYAVGQTLTAQLPTFTKLTPDSYDYDWYRLTYTNGHLKYALAQESGVAKRATYTLTEADFGHQMVVFVSAHDSVSSSNAYCDYNATPAIGRLGVPVSKAPSIAGQAKVGKRLTANPGTYTAGATVSYQWVRNGKAIAHAVGQKYKLKAKDKGKRVSVRVTYTKSPFNPTVLFSKSKKIT